MNNEFDGLSMVQQHAAELGRLRIVPSLHEQYLSNVTSSVHQKPSIKNNDAPCILVRPPPPASEKRILCVCQYIGCSLASFI